MKAWSWVPLFYLLSFRLVNVPFPKKHLIIVLEWQWVCVWWGLAACRRVRGEAFGSLSAAA